MGSIFFGSTPPGQGFDWRRNIARLVFVVMLVGGLAYYMRANPALLVGNTVQLTVSGPGSVTKSSAPTIDATVDLKLINGTAETQLLSVKNNCEIFRWIVLSTDGRLVEAMPNDPSCIVSAAVSELPAGSNMTETLPIQLDAKRYEPGRYQLSVSYWGYTADAPFSISQE